MSDERLRRLREHVAHLCSDACAGRAPGTPGSAAAREHLVAAFAAAGVAPAGEDGFLQEVPGCGFNVLARVPGAGALGERAVLVAAHYDHLGVGPDGSVYYGADDNAAAVAALLDLARELAAGPARDPGADRRQVILAAFDGEEPPHFLGPTMGSVHYTRRPTVPLEALDAMVCMDLVGHAVGPPHLPAAVRRSLFVLGAELSQGTPALVDALADRVPGLVPRRLGLDVIPALSDYYAFAARDVPVLFLTCGRWEHYHQPTDTPEKLDYEKILATADYLRALTLALATRPEAPVAFVRDGRDDLASLASLRAMGELLRPHAPQVALVEGELAGLERAAARGGLDASGRQQLSLLVGLLEQLLG